MKNIFYIITIISLSVLTFNKSFAYSYYNQYGGSYSDEQFRTDIKSYLDDEKWRQEKKDLEDLINNNSYNNSYTRNQSDYEKTYNDFKKTQQENEEYYKKTLEAIDNLNKQTAELEAKNEEQKIYNNTKLFCQSYKDRYDKGEDYVGKELVDSCYKYGVMINTSIVKDNTYFDKNCKSKYGNAGYDGKNCKCNDGYVIENNTCIRDTEIQNTDTNYKSVEQSKNTITLKEAIQRRKDIENNKTKNTFTLNEILNESKKVSTSTPATTSVIMPDTEIKQPIYKKVFNKIKRWFGF